MSEITDWGTAHFEPKLICPENCPHDFESVCFTNPWRYGNHPHLTLVVKTKIVEFCPKTHAWKVLAKL